MGLTICMYIFSSIAQILIQSIKKPKKDFFEFIIITETYLYHTIHFGKLKAVSQIKQAIYYELDYEAQVSRKEI